MIYPVYYTISRRGSQLRDLYFLKDNKYTMIGGYLYYLKDADVKRLGYVYELLINDINDVVCIESAQYDNENYEDESFDVVLLKIGTKSDSYNYTVRIYFSNGDLCSRHTITERSNDFISYDRSSNNIIEPTTVKYDDNRPTLIVDTILGYCKALENA